ncbi:hypothetical protein Sste5344_004537 [Sporothrix stenoceras]
MQEVFLIAVVTMPLCDDGVLVGGPMPTYDDYTKPFVTPEWCPRLMMGDAKNKCIIWNKSWENLCTTPMAARQDLSTPDPSLAVAKMQSFLGKEKADKKDMSPQDLFWALERLTTDGIFSLSIYFAEKAVPATQQVVSDRMVAVRVSFTNGEAPWPEFSDADPKFMMFDVDGGEGVSSLTKRSYATWDPLHEQGLASDVCRLSDELCLPTGDLVGKA